MSIKEFNPVLYPVRLWVSANPKYDEINRLFYGIDEDGEILDEFPKDTFEDNHTAAQTTLVTNKKSGYRGCLVTLHRLEEINSGIISHEASHCADWLCDTLGIYSHTFETGEARAYYVQWVADCIEKVRDKARKKKK